jgi:hypothetical protein
VNEKRQELSVNLTIIGLNQEEAVKVAEVLGRAQVGLALEGYSATLNMMSYDTEENAE